MKTSRAVSLTVLAAFCLIPGLYAADEAKKDQPRDWEPIKASNPPRNRYVTYQEYIAKGPQMKVLAATCFGGGDHETCLAAGELPDGTIMALGNAWGPSFPAAPAPAVLGQGRHRGLKPMGMVGKKEQLRPEDPDCAGFIAFYEPGLRGLRRLVKFDWGVASFSAARVLADGKGLILAGRATEAFRGLKDQIGTFKTQAGGGGQYTYEGVQCPGDVFVLRMTADASKIEWAWVLEGYGVPPYEVWVDDSGAVYFDCRGLSKVSPEGQNLKVVVAKPTRTGTSKWLFVDPKDGSAYFGGDRNTHTHREPWRQPFLYKFDSQGQKRWSLWEFPPGDMGADRAGLQSDSSVRAVALLPDGDLIVSGWSDGGNSVFQRLATDWKRNAPLGGFGMTPWWPKGANSFAHIMVLDPKTQQSKSHQWWVGYMPENFSDEAYRNRSNGLSIQEMEVLADGSLAVAGGAGTGLLQSPGAFWKDPGKGQKYGGSYLSVFNKDRKNLTFSSYLPGCSVPRLAGTQKGLVAAGGTVGKDTGDPVTPTPAVNALQPFAGATDGHLVLLER
jgi:hypothetical protein